jgi:hypothetical protein
MLQCREATEAGAAMQPVPGHCRLDSDSRQEWRHLRMVRATGVGPLPARAIVIASSQVSLCSCDRVRGRAVSCGVMRELWNQPLVAQCVEWWARHPPDAFVLCSHVHSRGRL